MQQKLKNISNKISHSAQWCLFGDKNPHPESPPAELQRPPFPPSTAYLTGLRGIAALFVYNSHLIQISFPSATDPFSSWRVSSVLQLPVLRIVYAGLPMVALFFLISGFVLSIKPLLLARQGKWGRFARSLASSVFRRGWRLFLPCVPSTFLVMLAARLHLFPDFSKMKPTIQDSLWAQVADWMSWFYFNLMNFWSWDVLDPKASEYGGHLWTIPFEFRDSLILYVSVLGTASLRPNMFVLFNLALLVFCLFYDKWDVELFIAGMLFANSTLRPPLVSLRKELKLALSMAAFFIGLYLASLPLGDGIFLFSGSQTELGVGLALFMGAVTHSSWLQRLLSSRPIQFLGYISFSFYIIHEPILQLLGWRMVPWFAGKLGGSLPLGLVCTWILLTPSLFFLASLYTRYVERPSLALARWLEKWCFVEFAANRDAEPELLDLIS